MAISTYAELQSTAMDFAHRGDLAMIMPTLVRLAEDVIYADLDSRQQDVKSTLSTIANTETVALPIGFMSFRSLSLSGNSTNDTLTYLTPAQYAQEYQYDYTGNPRAYTIIGNNLLLQPIPDAIYSLDAIYEARLVNLSDAATNNWLLTNYPSAYLYAVMMQICIYIKDDASLAKWSGMYQKVIEGINANDWANGNTMQVRTDVNLTNIRP